MSTSADVTATFCATLADEWVRCGVREVIVCPGSRSTPLALAVAAEPGLRVHVHHDERSGAFLALGIGLASGHPAVIVTTSGTAAVELHAAVVEAHQAEVPLIVATADRPPELQGVGAPQTIEQTDLYGGSVRWFHEPGVPDDDGAETWRALAARAVREALAPRPGPVHLNLAFREPLVGSAGALPPERADDEPHGTSAADGTGAADHPMLAFAPGARGVIVAGAGAGGGTAVHRLAALLGWPVLADPRSGLRWAAPETVAAADAILRDPATAERLRPEVVLRLGELPTSKVVNQWLDSTPVPQILVHPSGTVIDPGRVVAAVLAARPADLAHALAERLRPTAAPASGWLEAWSAAEATARRTIDAVLLRHPEPTEPGIARAVYAALPRGASLVVSASMPVRDVEWYGRPPEVRGPDDDAPRGPRVIANRGASGIDGVTSTAVGVALATKAPTVLLIGDVAFLHDTNGLLGLAARELDLTIVVVDNDGGGIFSFLPQRTALEPDRFELLFGTPHGVDLAALARAHGIEVAEPATAAEVGPAVVASVTAGGTRVILVRTDRAANVAVHDEIHAAVAAALHDL